MTDEIDKSEIAQLIKTDNILTASELKFILRLGYMYANSIVGKHAGGYRDKEIADAFISIWEISKVSVDMEKSGYASLKGIYKYREGGRRERVYLISITKRGLVLYFHCKSATRRGLQDFDLIFLDNLLENAEIALQDLDANVLLQYIDHIDLSEKLGYNISQFARAVLSDEERVRALSYVKEIKDVIDISPRAGISNANIEILYLLVRKLEEEIKLERPKRNKLKAILYVILQIAPLIGVLATIVSTVIVCLQYFG